MNKIQKLVASSVAVAGLLLNTALPVFADVAIEISGNGADSDNDAGVTLTQSTTVTQTNTANISNAVFANADTGGNGAEKNTGGDVTVKTGDASVEVGVKNSANSNMAEVSCCASGDMDVLISGNGVDTDNTVGLGVASQTNVTQVNTANIGNLVTADAKTGKNEAEKNTGGEVTIKTGDASVKVGIENQANSNTAKVGGGGGGLSLSARILGNGADSDNDIALKYSRSVSLAQVNTANIANMVFADADTGKNDAEKNTGGDVTIETGDADVEVGIDNMVNFNWADVNCGCLFALSAKIAGNGSDSKNTIGATLYDNLAVGQINNWYSDGPCALDKDGCGDDLVEAEAKTGGNDAEKNTGDPQGDPSVETGDAAILVGIENTGNANVFSQGSSLWPELPSFPDLPEIQFGFNWAFFLAWLGLFA